MQTKKIFLASSSELKEDRNEFEIFINRKNKVWVAQGVFLHLEVWEDFLDAMSQTRLQNEYNKAIRECDIFVMLFWTKVGKYTEEEFETAFGQFKATNKPFIFTYFKNAPSSSGNAGGSVSLEAFKKKLKVLGHFPTVYNNVEGLTLHFYRQLEKLAANGFIELKRDKDDAALSGATYQANVNGSGAIAQGPGARAVGAGGVMVDGNNSGLINTGTQTNIDNSGTIITGTQIVTNYIASGKAPLSKEQIAQQVAGYLRWLRERTENIELRGIERAGGAPVVLLPLETAYVPLRAKATWAAQQPKGARRRDFDDVETSRKIDVALNQVLSMGNRLVITGGPGSGKTTVLLHMAWALASSLATGQADPARSRLGLSIAPRELPLPIFVPFASFARYRRNLPGNAAAREKTLAHFISYHLISKQADFDLPSDFFVQMLKEGRDIIFLLDGLDEVANENERAQVRQSVEELVSGRDAMRVVVTCRTIAYRSGRTALGANFKEIAVQPLDMEQHIAPMVQQAYKCIYPSDGALRADRAGDLLRGIQALEENRRLRLGKDAEALVISPLMVRLLLIVHVNNRRLPNERADLFDKAINALLQVDYGLEESDIRELSTDWKLYRDMAQHLAYHMHQQGLDQGREIEESALRAILCKEAEFKPRVDDFLSQARQRGSVVEERSGVYRFIHLAFQEFLVGRYLGEIVGRNSRDALLALLDGWFNDPWWREPILLLAGYMAVNSGKPARDFLAALAKAGKNPNAQFSAAELAATAALEWRESGETIRALCAQRIATTLANLPSVVRARAGDTMARLGDPRFDQQRFFLPTDDNCGFVRIAPDPDFKIGTRKADAMRVAKLIGVTVKDNEINDKPTPTSEFYIGRYSVTVAQFRAFVEATQFKIGDADALRDPDNRPVRYVSWHDALKYCDWLNKLFATSPALAGSQIASLVRKDGWRITLPSELEWEKAARGSLHDKVFPWGDEVDPNRANYHDTGINAASATGCFAANDYGLYDMVGNVWQWTRTRYEPYPYQVAGGRELLDGNEERVVRGGSWDFLRDYARCAYRHRALPDSRYNFIGFRVVLRSPPVG